MERPIRILQVFGRLDRGGAETMLMNLYRCMDRTQLQFDFVIHTTDRCDYTEEIQRLGGKIYSMKPFPASAIGAYRRQWREFFKEHQEYGIVHIHMRSTASLYLSIAKRAGLVTIVHSHNTSSGKGLSALVKDVLQYPLRFCADYLFACSRAAGVWLYGKRACQSSRFYLLPNGIFPEQFTFDEQIRRAKRKEMQATNDTRVVLHVGRLEEQKNHKYLLQIMKEIARQEPSAVLWLCGVGPLEAELRAQAKKDGMDAQVHFLGTREDIPALMQAADIFLFPSLFEGLPVTVVEAQAAGLPVVMSDAITQEVVLTELVEAYPLAMQPDKWADKVLLALERKHENRKHYASQVAEKGYDVRKNAEKLAAFYRSIDEDRG